MQKTIRDESENLKVTLSYKYLNIICVILACVLMLIGLYNEESLLLNEKGFFGIAFILTLFSSIVVQKNIRDLEYFKEDDIVSKKTEDIPK